MTHTYVYTHTHTYTHIHTYTRIHTYAALGVRNKAILQCMSTQKKPYVNAKGPYVNTKEPYVNTKERYVNAEKAYVKKALCTLTQKPCIHVCMSVFLWRVPCR